MKLRPLMLAALVLCLGMGFTWWLQNSRGPELKGEKSPAKIAGSLPRSSILSSSLSSGVVVPPKSTRVLTVPLPPAVANNDEIKPPTPGIHIGKGPVDGTAAVLDRIKQQPGMLRPWTPAAYDPTALEVKPAYAIYEFRDPGKLAQGGGLETAFNFGFGYTIESPDAIVGEAEVGMGADGNTRIMNIGSPGGAQYLAQVLQQVAALAQVRQGSYEVRLLRDGRIGTRFEAIWLKAEDGGTDLIMPLGQDNGRFAPVAGLEAGKLYTESEFLTLFRPYAQEIVEKNAEHDAQPRPPDGSPYTGVKSG